MTLETYIAFLIATNPYSDVRLSEVLADFARIEAFRAFADGNVLSDVSKGFLLEGKKISAIKNHRAEHEKNTGQWLGLKEAKDVVDAYVAKFPRAYNVPF